jgi:hypothetical protein
MTVGITLGLSYESGFNVRRDRAKAVKWYKMAADQGVALAQKNLANLLADKNFAGRDYIQAYKWYEIAIPNLPDTLGRELLRVARNNVAKRISPDQRANARNLAVTWIKEFSRRTGKPISQIEGYTEISGGADNASGWKCDKVAIKSPEQDQWLNPCLLALPVGKWIQIHRQSKQHAVRFSLQHHGGSTFDTRRGRIILFGSDTHDALRFGNGELINSPLAFDVAKLRWTRYYPSDPIQTYSVNRSGIPVAGFANNHPWAMHTYGAVNYDHKRDEIVVSSDPRHMEPGRFVDSVSHLWNRIKYHPTWVFSFRTNRWRTLNTVPRSFFLYSTVYDSDQGKIIGYDSDGVFELSGRNRKWRQISRRSSAARHSNSIYDSKHKAVILFGGGYDAGTTNDIVVFWPKSRRHRTMPTPGKRPRQDAHVPMAYHPVLERTAVLIDEDAMLLTSRLRNRSSAQIWLYDLATDKWTMPKGGRLPLGLGMNYNMEYDPGHNLLLTVARDEKNRTTVWALRLERPSGS